MSNVVQVQRNGQLQNATLRGALVLDSLDVVAFEIDANSGQDVVKVAGSGTLHTYFLELNDGTRVFSPDAGRVNFGDPSVMPWCFVSGIALTAVFPAEPMLRQFQLHAHREGFQFIGRPFAHAPFGIVDVTYTRTQSVSKQIFMLGTFVETFV